MAAEGTPQSSLHSRQPYFVPEERSRLSTAEVGCASMTATMLREDRVVLLEELTAKQANEMLYDVAVSLGLEERLKLQATFAAFFGHRRNVETYFMTVNERKAFQHVSPHSEGSSFSAMQLASFYCYENSTDGGDTVLFNIDETSKQSHVLREYVTKVAPGSIRLSAQAAARARALYQLDSTSMSLDPDDRVIQPRRSEISGLRLVDVLTKTKATYSTIAARPIYAYWDSVSAADKYSLDQYVHLLEGCGLLKVPPGGCSMEDLDSSAARRLWSSGVNYADLFRSKVTLKLKPGDLIIMNNLTWSHAVANWSPNSGVRKVVAAFA